MQNVTKALIGLAGLGFLLAVIAVFTGPIMAIDPEAFSRASSNPALLAIALSLGFKESSTGE